MSCEIYDTLISSSLLSTGEEQCRFEKGCPKLEGPCKWGKTLRVVARNMRIEDTNQDLEQSRELAKLEAAANIIFPQKES